MPSHFDLIITADSPNRTAELRLLDAHGSQLAFRQTDFKDIAASRQQGLFDLCRRNVVTLKRTLYFAHRHLVIRSLVLPKII